MNRRDALSGLGALALVACGPRRPPPQSPTPPRIHAIAFDLFTLFDPRTVDRRVAAVIADDPAGFATAWKSRLFEDSWLHAAAHVYAPFDQLVDRALAITLRARHLELAGPARAQLAAAFVELDPWPDTRDALEAMRSRGLRLAPLANFSPSMIRALLASAKLDRLFEDQISTDAARTYKPDPAAYALAEQRFAIPRDHIAFAAFGAWDAWGASRFGLPTFWVDRLGGQPLDASIPSGADLSHLLAWLS